MTAISPYIKDKTFQKFGKLFVYALQGKDQNNKAVWNCVCDCGTLCVVSADRLNKARRKGGSCGKCREVYYKTFLGAKLQQLQVNSLHKNKHGHYLFNCSCVCGKEFLTNALRVVKGATLSCGCVVSEAMLQSLRCRPHPSHLITHGQSDTRFYRVWAGMKSRCNNPNSTSYLLYGGRGISLDERWEDFENFEEDMRSEYQEGYTIERLDVNGDYCRDNCTFIPINEQSMNTRGNSNSSSKYKGVSWNIRERKWKAQIQYKGVKINLGTYDKEEHAANAYDVAAKRYFKERAYLNFKGEYDKS